MLTILVLTVLVLIVLVLALLAVVVIGMRQEPPASELSSQAPRRTAALARWLLGVSVRKPSTEPPAGSEPESCLAGRSASAWPEGRGQ
jgi:hypothetical protein